SYEELVQPLPALHPKSIYYKTLKGLLRTVGQLSDGIRLGLQYGFDSGVMLEYIYQNKTSGRGWLGRAIDRAYLDAPGWKGIRERAEILKDVLRKTIHENSQRGVSTSLLDVASGGGRYVLEVFQEFRSDTVSAVLRDYKEENVQKALTLARGLGVSASIECGDAFSDSDLDSVNPRPNVIVVSGLHEILPDNDLIRTHFGQLNRILQAPGTLIFTIQPYHPQIESIARVLTSHSGGPWVMRLRPFDLTRQWAEDAGFRCIQVQMDSQDIFGVVKARKF
ncbi:MAG: class I SAM-dependent methyltransferase family protein, partial [Candidatus Methylomirabilales bacterium]